jgi:hypothetical protein
MSKESDLLSSCDYNTTLKIELNYIKNRQKRIRNLAQDPIAVGFKRAHRF